MRSALRLSQTLRSAACRGRSRNRGSCFFGSAQVLLPGQFFCLESVRLLAFGTLISFIAPLLRPSKEHRWLLILGLLWLVAVAIAVFSGTTASTHHDFLNDFRGPALSFALVYLAIRLTFSIVEKTAPPSVASL